MFSLQSAFNSSVGVICLKLPIRIMWWFSYKVVSDSCDPMPGSSVHGILQAKILEWIAMPCSRGSSQPKNQTCISSLLDWQAGSLPLAPPGKPITSWQIDGEIMETVTDFIFLGSKITVDGDCSHKIKRGLLLGRKVMTNPDSIYKKQRHYFANKGPSSQSYGFSSGHV